MLIKKNLVVKKKIKKFSQILIKEGQGGISSPAL
jgi:hypothetical protein